MSFLAENNLIADIGVNEMAQGKQWDDFWQSKKTINKLLDHGRKIGSVISIRLLKKYFNQHSVFCELGCGSSILLSYIAPLVKEVVGIDYSEKSIELSEEFFRQKNIINARFLIDDCRNLYIKEKFDIIWSEGLIEHFTNPARVIAEHVKIIKDNGHTVISAPHKYSLKYPWYLISRLPKLRFVWPWPDQIFFTRKLMREEYLKYCRKYGYHYQTKISFLTGNVILIVNKQ